MGMPKTLGGYADVREVLDKAMAAGGARYRLPTPGKATVWRHRANYFRKLLRDLDAETKSLIPGAAITTPYDSVLLRIEGCDVVIEMIKPEGELILSSGESAELSAEPFNDTLEEEARRFAEMLKKGEV